MANAKPTICEKLAEQRRYVASLVDRLNRDDNPEAAMVAQSAVLAINKLECELENSIGKLDFDWEPESEDE